MNTPLDLDDMEWALIEPLLPKLLRVARIQLATAAIKSSVKPSKMTVRLPPFLIGQTR